MAVLKANPKQLEEILAVYDTARKFMQANANPSQWAGGYPQRELLEKDIAEGKLYTVMDDGVIEGVFFFAEGPDSTYEFIKGEWLTPLPYHVVHRVASSGRKKGLLKTVIEFCFGFCDNIKIDTHKDNFVMQKALEKLGFVKCGIIYLENGEERIAYQVMK